MRAQNQNTRILVSTPLAILGIFLEVVKQRFAAVDDDFKWLYVEGSPNESKIDIRVGYNDKEENRDKRPTISIYRGDFEAPKQALNNMMSKNRPMGVTGYGSMSSMQVIIGCLSTNLGEAEIIGDAVWGWLLANREIIEATFDFHEVSNPILMAPRPFERDTYLTEVPVSFHVLNMVRWATRPVAPILQEIVLKLTANMSVTHGFQEQRVITGDSFFQQIAINSLTLADD